MNKMQQALLTAGVVSEDDVQRVDRQKHLNVEVLVKSLPTNIAADVKETISVHKIDPQLLDLLVKTVLAAPYNNQPKTAKSEWDRLRRDLGIISQVA